MTLEINRGYQMNVGLIQNLLNELNKSNKSGAYPIIRTYARAYTRS